MCREREAAKKLQHKLQHQFKFVQQSLRAFRLTPYIKYEAHVCVCVCLYVEAVRSGRGRFDERNHGRLEVADTSFTIYEPAATIVRLLFIHNNEKMHAITSVSLLSYMQDAATKLDFVKSLSLAMWKNGKSIFNYITGCLIACS